MGQKPSVRPDESKATDPELSMPEITSGNSQGVPVDNNPSVFRAAKTKSKIKKIHVTIGIIATVVVILVILIGVLFSEISSLKTKKQEENLKEKENENKAAIAELKAKDMKSNANIAALMADLKATKATIASLKNQTKSKDSQIMKIINKVKHVEVGNAHFCGTTARNGEWECDEDICTVLNTIPFQQIYDIPPLVAVMLDLRDDNLDENYWSLRVSSVEKNRFFVVCYKTYKKNEDNKDHRMSFSWISIPNI